MNIRMQNAPIFLLPDAHPARRFLEEFIECRDECVGREIPIGSEAAVDQQWYSTIDGKEWTFSELAYKFLAFDVELDGWLTSAPEMTYSERTIMNTLPFVMTLLAECDAAARRQGNEPVLPLVAQVIRLFDRWEECTLARYHGSADIR